MDLKPLKTKFFNKNGFLVIFAFEKFLDLFNHNLELIYQIKIPCDDIMLMDCSTVFLRCPENGLIYVNIFYKEIKFLSILLKI